MALQKVVGIRGKSTNNFWIIKTNLVHSEQRVRITGVKNLHHINTLHWEIIHIAIIEK